jgi:hypothetical protein
MLWKRPFSFPSKSYPKVATAESAQSYQGFLGNEWVKKNALHTLFL